MTIYEGDDDVLMEQQDRVWDENGGAGGGVEVKEQIVLSDYTTKVRLFLKTHPMKNFHEFDTLIHASSAFWVFRKKCMR